VDSVHISNYSFVAVVDAIATLADIAEADIVLRAVCFTPKAAVAEPA